MAQKTCYIKCVSNGQAQQLRGELVGVGFSQTSDDIMFNNRQRCADMDSIVLYGDHSEEPNTFCVYTERKSKIYCIGASLPLYTLTPDENLTEAAVKIKELFDNQ